jgi:hypothetical protein
MVMVQKISNFIRKALLPVLLVSITILYILPASVHTQEPTPSSHKNNPTVIENLKQGTTNWQLTNSATDREIEGYASLTSVNRGGEIKLFVNTKEPNYTIEIFRMGWYGGAGARQIIPAINRAGIAQPPPIVDEGTGLIECDWQEPYVLKISSNPNESTEWVSGFYLVKLTASKSGKQSYIIFVVRDDQRPSDILFQSSVTTYQAYNNWGGMSLYRWNSRGMQARKVSFNRPYAASPNQAAAYGVGAGEFLTNFQPPRRTSSAGWEYNMVRWLEKEGYDVTYATDVDTHENPLDVYTGKPMLLQHKAFLAVGHDEYWSYQMRRNIELARDSSVSLGFFAANTCYWQIRFEPSRITRDVNRTIVSYKESAALDPFARDNNPANDYLVTTLWRNQPVNRPEDALLGVMYETFQVNADILVDGNAPDWLLAGTQLEKNQLHLRGMLGYEVDRMFGNAPANTIRLAHSPYAYGDDTRYSDMTVYTAASGATVFATGSIQWSWGLDDYNTPQLRPSVLSADVQAMTRNVLAKLVISH